MTLRPSQIAPALALNTAISNIADMRSDLAGAIVDSTYLIDGDANALAVLDNPAKARIAEAVDKELRAVAVAKVQALKELGYSTDDEIVVAPALEA